MDRATLAQYLLWHPRLLPLSRLLLVDLCADTLLPPTCAHCYHTVNASTTVAASRAIPDDSPSMPSAAAGSRAMSTPGTGMK